MIIIVVTTAAREREEREERREGERERASAKLSGTGWQRRQHVGAGAKKGDREHVGE